MEELAYGKLDGIKEKLKEYLAKFQCTRDVIGKAVKDSEFEEDFQEFKKIVDMTMADFKKCSKADSKMDKLKCTINVFKSLPEAFSGFFEQLNKVGGNFTKQ